MKGNECLRLIRWFTIVDHEKEEEFLREQHRKGYALTRFVTPGLYYFEKCEPKDVVYRLDYTNNPEGDPADYRRMFEDYGWEYLFNRLGWSYFRKEAATDEDLELFSDDESRMALAKKVFQTRMLPLLILFGCCVIPQFILAINRGTSNIGILAAWSVLFCLYTYLIVYCGIKFIEMKRKYSNRN